MDLESGGIAGSERRDFASSVTQLQYPSRAADARADDPPPFTYTLALVGRGGSLATPVPA